MNGLDIKNIKLGDSLSSSITKKEDFNYLLSVPPFGQNWISQKELIQKSSLGTFAPALPRKSDSSLSPLQVKWTTNSSNQILHCILSKDFRIISIDPNSNIVTVRDLITVCLTVSWENQLVDINVYSKNRK